MKYIIFSILFVLSCKDNKTTETTQKSTETSNSKIKLSSTQSKNAGITLGELSLKQISSTIKVNGKIEVPPQNLVSISIPMGGYLKSTHLLPGTIISKGQVIATVEDAQFIKIQQEYLTTKAKLQLAESEFTRQKELNESKASSDKVYQIALAEVQTLRIAKSALSEELKLLQINPLHLNTNNLSKSIKIYSPFSGYVAKVNANIGKYLLPSDVLFELINPNDIHLNLKVFEKDINNLSIGQSLVAYTNNDPTKLHPCKIILISKSIAPDGTTEVHCHFDNYSSKLLSGMYMNASINIKNNEAWALPETAVVNYESKNYVFIALANNQFQMIEISVGKTTDGYIEIINSAAISNQKIVINGAYSLLMTLKNTEE